MAEDLSKDFPDDSTKNKNDNDLDEEEDSLDAMKARVAAIEAEAKKISEMTGVDGFDESLLNETNQSTELNSDEFKQSKSISPSITLNVNQTNDKDNNLNNNNKKPDNNTDNNPNNSTTDQTSSNSKNDESNEQNWPSTIEEQQELDSRSVFISNVDHNTDANELKNHFESCGTIERITIVCDKWTGRPKGCAYIQFKSKESVASATLLNDKEFNGRIIKVTEKRTNLPPWLRNRTNRSSRGRYRPRRPRGPYFTPFYGGYPGFYRPRYRPRYWGPY